MPRCAPSTGSSALSRSASTSSSDGISRERPAASAWRGPRRAADDQLEREQLAQRLDRPPGERLEEEPSSAPSALQERLAHRGQPDEAGDLDVVEADDGKLFGHADPECPGGVEGAQR